MRAPRGRFAPRDPRTGQREYRLLGSRRARQDLAFFVFLFAVVVTCITRASRVNSRGLEVEGEVEVEGPEPRTRQDIRVDGGEGAGYEWGHAPTPLGTLRGVAGQQRHHEQSHDHDHEHARAQRPRDRGGAGGGGGGRGGGSAGRVAGRARTDGDAAAAVVHQTKGARLASLVTHQTESSSSSSSSAAALLERARASQLGAADRLARDEIKVEVEKYASQVEAKSARVAELEARVAALSLDCRGEWSAWGECSVSCGGGMRSRIYSVVKEAEVGTERAGLPCPHPDKHVQLSKCNEFECAAACEGRFTPWGECSAPCGRGRMTRRYEVIAPARGGGSPCPHEHNHTEAKFCERVKCLEECPGRWSDWSACVADCGVGARHAGGLARGKAGGFSGVVGKQHRTFSQPEEDDAAVREEGTLDMEAAPKDLCPHKHGDVQVRACEAINAADCPLEVRCPGEWSEWSTCSDACGGGTQERTFTLAVDVATKRNPPRVKSDASEKTVVSAPGCEAMRDKVERRDCNVRSCPDDCKGTWQEWEPCSESCGATGHRQRRYAINWKAKRGGAQCPHDEGDLETEPCNRHPCPVACVGEWTPWSECTRECGNGGHQSRTFRVKVRAAFGGDECHAKDGALERRSCNTRACVPGDCVGRWDAWSECSARCGTGFQTRGYVVEKPAHHSGKPCAFRDGALQSRACNSEPCTVACEGQWSDWSECSAECGGGQKWRTYKITRFPEGKGALACPIADGAMEVVQCGTGPCPRDCRGQWGPWSRCSAACGGGQQLRQYVVLETAENGGVECAFGNHTEQRRACNQAACSRDCVGSWGDWTECTVACGGGGTRRRRFHVDMPHAAGGKRCEARHGQTEEDKSCGNQPCVVDCEGAFEPWSRCTRACGTGGTSSRRYIVSRREAGGGKLCPRAHESMETRPCNDKPCPADCVGGWGPWTACSETCGAGGTRQRVYAVSSLALNGGAVCPFADGAVDIKPCNTNVRCDADCEGGWAQWGECSLGCHGGFQRRVYAIRKEAQGTGVRCPHVHGESETRKCPAESCPRPCVGVWTSWSECSEPCGGGIRNRTFDLMLEARNGGACPARGGEVQSESCNTHACATDDDDCVGAFTPWSKCSHSCDGGTRTRTFKVTKPAVASGQRCEFDDGTMQEEPCNTHKRCPRDCVGNFTVWSKCDARCGGGTMARTYRVLTPSQRGGRPCPYADGREDIRRCNEQSCDADCFGAWTPWTRCTRPCGGGLTRRRFKLLRPAGEGGKPCVNSAGEAVEDGDEEDKMCNEEACEAR